MTCAPSEDSDQPGHLPSLIRIFAVRLKKVWVLSYPKSAQPKLFSDWADTQADLSLSWVHRSSCWFCDALACLLLTLCLTLSVIICVGFGMFVQEQMESAGRSGSTDHLPYQRTRVSDIRGAEESGKISRLLSRPGDWWKGSVKIRTPEKLAEIVLKFEQCGFNRQSPGFLVQLGASLTATQGVTGSSQDPAIYFRGDLS